MSVSTYALTTVAEILTWLGTQAYSNAFWIWFSGTSGTTTIKINDATLVLVDADNGTTIKTFANSSDNTLTKIIGTINDVAGWECGLIYNGNAASSDLRITGTLNAEGESNEQVIQILDTYKIEKLIDRATSFIEHYCNRKLKNRTYTQQVYNGNGFDRLLLREYPVTAVDSVAIGRANAISVKYSTACTSAFIEANSTNVILTVDGTATEIAIGSNTINQLITLIDAQSGWDATLMNSTLGAFLASEILNIPALHAKSPSFGYLQIPDDYLSDYYLESDNDEWLNNGTLIYPGGFPGGRQNIFITFDAGYVTIPAALEEACIRLVARRYSESKSDPSKKKETLGDYSYENFDFNMADVQHAWPPELRGEINLFKRRLL